MKSQIIFEEYDIVTSTNDVVKMRVLNDERRAGGMRRVFFVRSDEQTKGRGSNGRVWVSQKGGLFLSGGCFVDEVLREDYAVLVTDAVIQFLRCEYDLNVVRKGINDVFFEGKKLGGVLVETIFRGNELSGVIIGVGLNVSNPTGSYNEYNSVNLREIGVEVRVRELGFKLFPVLLELLESV